MLVIIKMASARVLELLPWLTAIATRVNLNMIKKLALVCTPGKMATVMKVGYLIENQQID